MLAAVLPEPGGPEVFQLQDVPIPEPGAGEVLIRVAACGVSSRDVAERRGIYRRDVVMPSIPGLEIAGTVVELGAGVTGLQQGDRICTKAFISCGACNLCRNGRESTCFSRRPVRGGYAEYVALPQDAAVLLPDAVPFEEGCSLGPCAGVALNAVRDTTGVTVGESVLVTGASGGVGWPTMQLVRLAGARVIAVTRRADKVEELRAGGADEVVTYESEEDFSPAVRELTDGAGVDVVVDNVGSTVFDACFNSLAVHGRYGFVGQLAAGSISISPARIFFKRAQLLGVGSVSRSQLEDVAALAAAGKLCSRVARVLPLTEIVAAHELVDSGRMVGRVVVRP